MPSTAPAPRPGPRPAQVGFAPTVLLSMAGVAALATIQHVVVMGVGLHLRLYLVPLAVGAVFGTQLALVRRARARERAAADALAIRDAEILAMNEVLEERVRVRTAEVEQKTEALLRSQRLEVLGHVAGGVAHDFNNILTAMLGCAAALRDEVRGLEPGRARTVTGILDELDDCAERARALTARLLTLGRSNTGREEPRGRDGERAWGWSSWPRWRGGRTPG